MTSGRLYMRRGSEYPAPADLSDRLLPVCGKLIAYPFGYNIMTQLLPRFYLKLTITYYFREPVFCVFPTLFINYFVVFLQT